jgi:hypothetical protein
LREGRGSVRRLDRGTSTVQRYDARHLEAQLSGDHLRGEINITTEPDGRVRFHAPDCPERAEGA